VKNLSVLASKLARCARACDEFAADPITQYYGVAADLMPLVAQKAQEAALHACREHGFLTVTHAVLAIEARTTDKWLYQSGLLALVPRSEDIIV
jgi:hypothetical protein